MRYTLKVGYLHSSRKDEGQVSIIVVLAVGLFLLLFVGFGVDMTNLFFHRQMAQNVADAACVAAGMDMLKQRVNGRCTNAGGSAYACGHFTVGTPFNCAGDSTPAPCQYAALNGYDGKSATIPLPGAETNSVQVSFPASVPGIVTPAAILTGPNPFVQVDVYDGVKVYFSSLLSQNQTQVVHALTKCGLQVAQQPVPILVLDPTEAKSFQIGGNPTVQIVGGPDRSIQVNSDASSANASGDAAYLGGASQVDLTKAGLNYNGADFGVTGGPNTESMPSPFNTNPPFGWLPHVAPVPDPFASVPPPADPGKPGKSAPVPYLFQGCPDSTGCIEYTAGDYVGGISVQNSTAIFDPGVYYIQGGQVRIGANSLVRPSTAPGDGSMGTIFYLTCANPGNCTPGNVASVYIGANAGGNTADAFDTSLAHCSGDGGFAPQAGIPPSVGGNVFLAPCAADGTYPQAPQSVAITTQRGILFFGDRSAGVQETMNGGGGLLLAGTMYFRDCPNLLTAGTCNDPPTDFQTVTYLTGGSGSGTRVFGEIVTDQLTLQGNSGITMDLNPWSKPVLKVALMQ